MIRTLNNTPDVYKDPKIRVEPTSTGYRLEVGFTDFWDDRERWRACAEMTVFTKLGVKVGGWRLTRWYKRYVRRQVVAARFSHDNRDAQT